MKNVWYVFVVLGFVVACGGEDSNEIREIDSSGTNDVILEPIDQTWLIPIEEVLDGGPGKDGIPSLDQADYISVDDPLLDIVQDEDLVVGVLVNGHARAYPHLILDWHEIVNNTVGNESITINYCPLTGTAFSWKSESDNVFSTFGVSGLLYNANLILYDRETDSYWSQLRLQCVSGSQKGEKAEVLDIIETTWGQWKALYPDSDVLSPVTGWPRTYTTYPYGDYKTNHDFLLFPASPLSTVFPNKKRVFAILDGKLAKVYNFEDFQGGNTIKDSFNEVEYLLVGDENFITAYQLPSEFQNRNYVFEVVPGENSSVFKDDFGSRYSIFGQVVEGTNTGMQLPQALSVTSYWFAISAFYPNPIIY